MTVTLPTASTAPTSTSDFTTTLSQIRSKIGDAGGLDGTARVYLTDERINAIYTLYPSVTSASVECVRAIMADIAKDTDYSAGAISVNGRSQVFQNFQALLVLLERERDSSITTFVGGSSYAQINTVNSNSDIPRRAFSIGMDTNR